MPMFSRLSLVLMLSVVLISCSKKYTHLNVSQFVLEKDIVIQTGYQQAYFQSGKITTQAGVNPYNPYCELLTDTSSTNFHTVHINSDVFLITEKDENSTYGESYANSSGHKESATYTSVFLLKSIAQPHVLSLNCFRWAALSQKKALKLSEINQIVGRVGRFIQ